MIKIKIRTVIKTKIFLKIIWIKNLNQNSKLENKENLRNTRSNKNLLKKCNQQKKKNLKKLK